MAKKKAILSKAKRVKAIARERVGSPKPARVLADKRERPKPKYTKKWSGQGDAE